MHCIFSVNLVVIVLLLELSECACPDGYTHRFGKKCYLLKDYDVNQAQNEDFCRKSGGILATIETKAENDFILSIVTKGNRYWIGLKRSKVGVAQFTWFDRSPVNYTNWAYSYPRYVSESEWGAYLYSSNGYWYDSPANSNRYQLCQWIDADSKKLEPVTRVVDQLEKRPEELTRDLTELVKQAIGRVSDVTRNLTAALEKISNIEHRLALVETWNKTLNVRPRIVRIGKDGGIEILQP